MTLKVSMLCESGKRVAREMDGFKTETVDIFGTLQGYIFEKTALILNLVL
jgi:hypothetical protein